METVTKRYEMGEALPAEDMSIPPGEAARAEVKSLQDGRLYWHIEFFAKGGQLKRIVELVPPEETQ